MAGRRPPGLAGILHVALTVTDAEASAGWYERALGFVRIVTVPHAGGLGIVICSPDQPVWIVLHHHDADDGRRFSETATGLDHVCFQVDSYAAPEAWRDWFAAEGMEDTPITHLVQVDMPALVSRDPANLQLELITYGTGTGRERGGE
jgi:glyoxylase I family protein